MFEIVDAIKTGDVRLIVAQGLGIVAFIVAALSFQRKTQRGIVIMQGVSVFCFSVHYFLLGGTCGFILNTLAFLRAIVYSFRKTHKWAASIIWLWVFEALTLATGVYAYFDGEGAVAVLATVGTLIATVGYRMENAKLVRRVTLLQSPFWLMYDGLKGSVGGVLSETVSMISIVIGIIRLDIKKKEKNTDGETEKSPSPEETAKVIRHG